MKLSRNPILLLIFLMISVSLASASINYDTQSQTYTIDTWIPTWIGGNGQSQVHLIENTEKCLINCHFTIEFQNEEPVSLLEDLEFKDRNGNNVIDKIQNLNFQIGTYQNITTTTPIYETQCTDIYNETNQTTSQQCEQIFIQNQTKTHEELIWQDYNGEDVEGLNYLRATATKSPMTSVDWIITFRGEELGEWAWWDGSWNYKKELTITSENGMIIYLNVSYNAHMQNDFDDIRFLNGAEDTELNYTLRNKVDGEWATYSVMTSGEGSIYIYYGNTGANYNGNFDDVYLSPDSYYVFNESSGNLIDVAGTSDLTEQGTIASVDGWIGKARGTYSTTNRFTGFSNDISVGTDIPFSFFGYAKVIPNSAEQDIIVIESSDTSNDMHNYFRVGSSNQLQTYSGYRGTTTINYDFGSAFPTNTWTSVGFVYRSDRYWVMYQDGVDAVSSNSHNSGSDTDSNRISIGAYYGGGGGGATTSYFDEFALYLRQLNSNEVSYISNRTEPVVTFGAEQQNSGSIAVDFVTPPTPTNNSEVTNFTVQVNATYTNSSLTNITYDFYNLNGTLTTFLYPNETYTFNGSILPEGAYDYNVTICGNETINNSVVCGSTETRRILLDISPPVFNGTSPMGTYDYLIVNQTLDVNWTIIDEGVGVDSCWFYYNAVRIDVNCTDNHSVIYYVEDVNNLTGYANDTLGQEINVTINWYYKLLEVNQTYNEEITEGSVETFLAHIKLGSGISIQDAVLFNYNNSQATGQAFTSGDYEVLRKADYVTPNVEADTNLTFYWHVTLSDATEINLSSQNQTIYKMDIDNCSSYTVEIYNFTVVDEETQTILPNATIETAFNLYDETRTQLVLNYSALFMGINPLTICLNRNITNGSSYSLDVIARYEDSGNANEYYNIVNTTIDNETESQKITLYDLNISDSTEFQLTFTGSDFLPVENALVYVDRQYISENVFKTVELPKTDYNGQTILHLVRNDVIYNIRIIKSGVVLGNFENLVAFCDDFTIGDCNIELNAFDSVEAVFNSNEALGITFSTPTYNATSDKISFNFITQDGESKTVKMEVTRNDIFGNRSICNSTLVSSGGTLTCNIDPNLEDTRLNVEILVDSELAVTGEVQLDTTGYGIGGALIFVVFLMSCIFMFKDSKNGVMISISLGYITGIGFGWINGSILGVGAGVMWMIVVTIVGIIKLSKERPQ